MVSENHSEVEEICKSAVVFEDSDGESVDQKSRKVELTPDERLAIAEREASMLRDELLREASEISGVEAKISKSVGSEDDSAKAKKELLASAEKRKRVSSGDPLSAKKAALSHSELKINTSRSDLPPPPALTINTSCTVEKYATVQVNLVNIIEKSGCAVELDVNVQPKNGKLHTIKLTGQAEQIATAQKMISEVVRPVKLVKPLKEEVNKAVEEPEVDDGLPPITINMSCPQDKVRLVIGKQGATIKDLSKKSGCTIDVLDGVRGGMQEIAVTGKPMALSKAIAQITAIIGVVDRSDRKRDDARDGERRERSRDRGRDRDRSPDRDRRGSRGNGRDSRAHRDRDNFGEVRESFRGRSTSRERALREGRVEAVGGGDNFGRDRDIQQQPVVRSAEAIAQLQREHEAFQLEQRHRQEQFNQQQQQRFGGQSQDYNQNLQFQKTHQQHSQQQQIYQQQPVQQQALQMQPQGQQQQQPIGFTPFPIQMASPEQLQALYQQVMAQQATPFNPWETYVDAGLASTATVAPVTINPQHQQQQQVEEQKNEKVVGEKYQRHKRQSAAAQEQREAVKTVQKQQVPVQHEQQQEPVQQQQLQHLQHHVDPQQQIAHFQFMQQQQPPQQVQAQYAVNPVASVAPQQQVGQFATFQPAVAAATQPVHQTWQPTKEQAEKILGQPLSAQQQQVHQQAHQADYQQPQQVQQFGNNNQTNPVAYVAPQQQQQYGQQQQNAQHHAASTAVQHPFDQQYPGYQQTQYGVAQPVYGQPPQQQQQQIGNQWAPHGDAHLVPIQQGPNGNKSTAAPQKQTAVTQSQQQQQQVAHQAPGNAGVYPHQQQMYGQQQAHYVPQQVQQQQPVYGAPQHQQQGGFQQPQTDKLNRAGERFGLGQQAIQMAQQQQQYGQRAQHQQAPAQNPYLQHQVQVEAHQHRNVVAGPAQDPRVLAQQQRGMKRY